MKPRPENPAPSAPAGMFTESVVLISALVILVFGIFPTKIVGLTEASVPHAVTPEAAATSIVPMPSAPKP